MKQGSRIDIHAVLRGGDKRHLGQAQIVRSEWNDTHYPRYACRFREKPANWVLQ
jgi:hypothetical protein